MATTIPQSFLKFRQNLEISAIQASTVSTRQSNIRKILENGLEVESSFLTGSYQRNTMIAPLKKADIDIFFVLDSKYFYNYTDGKNGGQAGLLDLVKRTLRRTYTETPDISRDGQAVTIQFTDFMVDVVPGFRREGGGYLIPNSILKNWISTDPQKHVEIVRAANIAHNGDLVPLIKMIKAWNRNSGKFFSSFHLEVLAVRILDNVAITNYWSGARYFFDKARGMMDKKLNDPAGYDGDIGAYINTRDKILEAQNKLELAFERAVKAESYASNGNTQSAIEMWIKIFGDYFPVYG
jgi:hypothetical protein